jgi:hypothetical protein
MKKHQLLEQAKERIRIGKVRAGYEQEIINALPPNISVNRVYCGVSHAHSSSSSQGQVEIEVETFAQALGYLDTLAPAPMSRIVMRRQKDDFPPSFPTTSFYPDGLVKGSWKLNAEVTSIYPVIFQMLPTVGGKQARVYLEWFVLIRDRLFANIRVFIKKHGCDYNGYKAQGYPDGVVRKFAVTKPEGHENVTVYWYQGTFDEGHPFDEFLLCQEVAHV